MEQNREPRNKPTCLRSIDLPQRRQKYRKDSLFIKWCWKSGTPSCKSTKLEHILSPYTKINSKWLKDLNLRHDIIKLLKENTGKTYSDINHTNVFLGQFPKEIEIKAKINKQGLIKCISFYIAKKTILKQKDNLQTKRKKLQMIQLRRAYLPKYTNSISKKKKNQKTSIKSK